MAVAINTGLFVALLATTAVAALPTMQSSAVNETCMVKWLLMAGSPQQVAIRQSIKLWSEDIDEKTLPTTSSSLLSHVLYCRRNLSAIDYLRGCVARRGKKCREAAPCQNGGVCRKDLGVSGLFHCQCKAGFFGDFCTKLVTSGLESLLLESKRPIQQNSEKISQLEKKLFTIRDRKLSFLPPLITEACSTEQTLNQSGVYRFKLSSLLEFSSFCDMTTDGGRWLVVQRRFDGSEDFYRNYAEYVAGFGKRSGEFWLGLETLHNLTAEGNYEVRFDLGDFSGNYRFAKYSTFNVAGSSDGYRLTISGYSGNAGDGFPHHNGRKFTTKDNDQDDSAGNCAVAYHGAWWYYSCHAVNINGLYGKSAFVSNAKFVSWAYWKKFFPLMFTEMKIRLK